jgi:hypothetical protein
MIMAVAFYGFGKAMLWIALKIVISVSNLLAVHATDSGKT